MNEERGKMGRIKIERNPSKKRLEELDIESWGIWTKEVSEFAWSYDVQETCYFLEGEVIVTTEQGEAHMRKGDLVTFPQGLSCKWKILQPVRKYFTFG